MIRFLCLSILCFSSGLSFAENNISSWRDAAKKGLDYTKTIPATKGRAAYIGERSIGHEDPGAMSSLIMVRELFNFLKY